MHIAIVTSIFPPDSGGPATYVPAIATALTERGHSVAVVTSSDVAKYVDTQFPFRVCRVSRQPRRQRMWHTLRATLEEARQSDVIFANGPFIEATIAAILASKPLVMKIVGDWVWERCSNNQTITDSLDEFQRKQYRPTIEVQKQLRNRLTRRAQQVIVPSAYLRNIVRGWGVRDERLSLVYNARQLPDPEANIELEPFEGHTLVTVGRLVRWKGIDGILGAIAALPQTRLIVIGDGPLRSELERLAVELAIENRVRFVGNISRAEVVAYMHLADVFVLNSTYEGLPHVVIEAMLSGTPVIATKVGGTGELIQDRSNGRLISAQDVSSLVQALQELLASSEERSRLAAAAYTTAQQQFGFQVMVDQTESILQACILGSS